MFWSIIYFSVQALGKDYLIMMNGRGCNFALAIDMREKPPAAIKYLLMRNYNVEHMRDISYPK